MKKIISIISAALLVMLTCVSAYAAETKNDVSRNTDIFVYAKYVDNTDFTVIPTDENGNGSVTLPDDTEITVNDTDSTNGRIVVEEVTEKEVLDWAAKVLGKKSKSFRVFYIYRIDKNGKSQLTSGVTVSIKTSENAAYFVYALSGDKGNKLNANENNGAVSFTTDGSSFYALCGASGKTAYGKSPQTGDCFDIALLSTLLLVSGGAVILTTVCGRNKKHREN